MSINKLEQAQLKQIQEVNNIEKALTEGFLGRGLIRLLFGGKAKRVMKAAVKAAKDDPELQVAFQGLKYHHEQLEDLVDSFCDRFPDHKNCK